MLVTFKLDHDRTDSVNLT